MECTSILEPGGQSYLLVTGVYQDPLAHCDSVFIRQNGTRQYFCTHIHTNFCKVQVLGQFDEAYRGPKDAIFLVYSCRGFLQISTSDKKLR